MATNNHTLDNATVSACSAERLEFKLAKYAFYGVIFIVSLIGNSFVCYNVWKRARMKTVMNYFLVNLATCDLAFTSICLPFDIPVQENGYQWPYHPDLCKVIFPLQTMCAFASVFTLVAIALSRHRAVVHPMKKQLSLPTTRLVIGMIWLAAMLCVIPYALVLEVNLDTKRCTEHWPAPSTLHSRAYTMFIFTVQYIIPLGVMFWAYVDICREIRINRLQTTPSRARESVKVVKMAIAVTLLFTVCMLPNHIVWLLLDFLNSQYIQCNRWFLVANICVFINSAGDPVVFTIFNQRYREEFLKIVPHCCREEHKREESDAMNPV